MSTRGRRPRRPADTPEGRENQLISLAYDRAEQQMIEGTASAQVLTHFLKMGSTRNKLEEAKIQHENLLLAAKVEEIAKGNKMEELVSEAIRAMRSYTGQEIQQGGFEYYDDDPYVS